MTVGKHLCLGQLEHNQASVTLTVCHKQTHCMIAVKALQKEVVVVHIRRPAYTHINHLDTNTKLFMHIKKQTMIGIHTASPYFV